MNENKTFNNVMDSFINDYVGRDESITFSDWLGGRLRQAMPDLSKEVSTNLSVDIIHAVAEYDDTLDELNKAVESGQSKDEWLANKLIGACEDIDMNQAGEKLRQIEENLYSANVADGEGESENIKVDEIGWNKYNLKEKALDIGQEVILSGFNAAAAAIEQNMDNNEGVNASEAFKAAINSGKETANAEIKAVVAGVIKTVAVSELDDTLPTNISTSLIGDISGMAVEISHALADLATGECTMLESQDRIGKAGIAGSCRMLAGIAKEAISPISYIPIIGNPLVRTLDCLIDKTSEKVSSFVFETATSLREGLHKVENKVKNGFKNFAKKIFS